MNYVKKAIWLIIGVCGLVSTYILRVSSQSVKDEYAYFTNSFFILCVILIAYFLITKLFKNNTTKEDDA